ncbi:MAG TPA: L,D-transpeptidase family protein [Spirillospora sp.]|nr:L,D-transpeptidase family protein [Spirillospora sp.]
MYQETQLHRPISPKPAAARPQQRPPARKQKRWLPYAVVGGVLAGGAAMLACALTLLLIVVLADRANRIPDGVTVAGIDVSGQQIEAAQRQLQQSLSGATVTLADNNRTQSVRLSDLGIGVDYAASAERAQQAAPGSNVMPVYQIDLVQTQSALVNLSEHFNIEPVWGNPPQMGRALEIPVLLERLRSNLEGELADGVIELPMIVIEPPEPEALTTANYNGPTTIHVVEKGQELGLISKQYNVPIAAIVSLNGITNPDLLYVGQELIIPAAGVYVPSAAEAPPPPTSSGKAIVVSVGTQRIYAYENGQLVRSHLVSTGLPKTPTLLGDYSIYVKHVATDMRGPDYFLPQVPYTMYYHRGYGIHGTYWHNAFGRPMSHGCVNLPVHEAEWFFNWAQVGTPVRVVA